MDNKKTQVLMGIVIFVILYASLYIFSFPFSKNEIGEKYTINEIKVMCSDNIGQLENLIQRSPTKICYKYNKLFYSLTLGMILSVSLILAMFYGEHHKEDMFNV